MLLGTDIQCRRTYRETYNKLHRRSLLRRVLNRFFGRSQTLISLSSIEAERDVHTRSHAGIRSVPIEAIKGSEGRCRDFDSQFRPLTTHNQERWVEIAVAYHRDVTLPLIELIQIDKSYFIRDGHHRVSVAHFRGQKEIEAEVTVWHTTRSVEQIMAAQEKKESVLPQKRQILEKVRRVRRSAELLWEGFPPASGSLAPEGG